MRRLIAIVSCHSYAYPKQDEGGGHRSGENKDRASAIRRTWYGNWLRYKNVVDLKFFYGRGADRCPDADEVFLDCGDDYYSLPEKVQKTFEWCLANGYDQVLKCDDDVFVFVDRLVSDFRNDDYRGFEVEAAIGKYASGTAYWISHRAMEIIVGTKWNPTDWAEDKFVGKALSEKGIPVIHDPRFQCCHCPGCESRYPMAERITTHTVDPNSMVELWQMTS
jgi:hypothetical protein